MTPRSVIPVPADIQASHLFDRILWARENLKRVEPQYAVVFEDPAEPDAPAKVLHPAPEWLAMALNGYVLPPITTYLADQEVPDGEPKAHPYAAPIGPMTEEEAIEYLIMKDIPQRVWNAENRNKTYLRITNIENVPSDRTYRNAWKLKEEALP
jgi:hypothetical protein